MDMLLMMVMESHSQQFVNIDTAVISQLTIGVMFHS